MVNQEDGSFAIEGISVSNKYKTKLPCHNSAGYIGKAGTSFIQHSCGGEFLA